MGNSDLSSVTASGIWMRIFRSVFLHYSVDPQSYRKLHECANTGDLQCTHVTGSFVRAKKVEWGNALTVPYLFPPS
jgi:hypothetical protein